MAAPKRSEFEREQQLVEIQAMYLRGARQMDIAAEFNISQPQISRDLATIKARWRNTTTINLDEAKQKELIRIDELERTYWTAWERSLDEKVKTRTEKFSGDDGRGKASVEKETLLGVPAYLTGVQWCISERCKILGLYAPVKNDQTGLITLRVIEADEGTDDSLTEAA